MSTHRVKQALRVTKEKKKKYKEMARELADTQQKAEDENSVLKQQLQGSGIRPIHNPEGHEAKPMNPLTPGDDGI